MIDSPTRLYIIGNGFDRHHLINSSYSDFYKWLRDHHSDVINKVDEVYGYCDDDWWGKFEDQLASLDAISYGERIAFYNRPDFSTDDFSKALNNGEDEVKQELDSLYSKIRDCFHNWICQLNKPQIEQKIILETSNSVFLSFNYTKTLEDVYNIDSLNIIYIHGCIDRNEEFIIGHGMSYEDICTANENGEIEPPDSLSADEYESFFSNYSNKRMPHEQLAIEAAIQGVASQRKPVEIILERYKNFFGLLCCVQMVSVYGLSISNADIPYLRHISTIAKNANWEFSDYGNENRQRILNFCNHSNIRNFRIVELDDLKLIRQLKIGFTI